MKRQNAPTYWNDISVTIDGAEIKGSYSVNKKDDWMTVRMNGGLSKGARAGLAAESTACIVLRELYQEAKRTPD